MGTVSVAQLGHLYWLGRYLERVKMTLDVSSGIYGKILDDEAMDISQVCRWLSIPNVYGGPEDFAYSYIFDAQNPDSIISNMGRAFDNAIVLRDVIHSQTLAYVQLAYDKLEDGAQSQSPMLEIQETIDYLYAFWGALGDYVEDVRMRNTVRTGGSVERVDLALRLGEEPEAVRREIARLADRIYRSQLDYNAEAFERLLAFGESDDMESHKLDALMDVERLIAL